MFETVKFNLAFRRELRKLEDKENKAAREAMVRFMSETNPELASSYMSCARLHALRAETARKLRKSKTKIFV